MKINIEIKITPDPKEGEKTKPQEETCVMEMDMSKGFGSLLNFDGLGYIAKDYARQKMNEEQYPLSSRYGIPTPITHPLRNPYTIDEEDDVEYLSKEELEEFRNWKLSKKTK